MILFFDLKALLKLSKDNPDAILKNLQEYYDAKKRKHLPKYPLRGTSWILYPEPLFNNTQIDIGYRVQYILLAARRDYYLYRTYGTKNLILSYFPDLELSKITHNPLLTITQTEIKFKYEG